jgi:7-cyano-7-deazaguanine synthase
MSKIAVLVSGGMDSSILTVDLADQGNEVYPVYIEQDLFWEATELDYLERFLKEVNHANIRPLKKLLLPAADLYDSHWSVSGNDVPDEKTADEAVYLPGRNLLLLSKAGIWCSLNNIKTIALAPLKGNPFSDNTDLFYDSMVRIIDIAVDWHLEIIRPYSTKDKDEVIEIGRRLPLELTFSCIKPISGLHCGACNKCAERKIAYRKLGLNDNTDYAEHSELVG